MLKKLLVITILLALFAGCSKKKELTFSELRDIAVAAKTEVEKARKDKDADKAVEAKQKAETAAAEAEEKLKNKKDATDSDKALVDETRKAANETKRIALLTEDECKLDEILRGWKGKGYRVSRKLLIKSIFTGLSYSAEQADKIGLDELPDTVRETAEFAADMAHEYTGRGKLADGKPDWKNISSDLEEMAASPPEEISAMLAVAYIIAGQKKLALYEAEMMDLSKIEDRDRKLVCLVIRAAVISFNDMPNLAISRMEAILKEYKDADEIGNLRGTDSTIEMKSSPKEMLGLLHIGMAYVHFDNKKYEEADREVVRSIKIWPNNPVSVFLTGEILLADGKKKEAVESLEKAAAGTDSEWIAKIITDRAKEIRDGKGESESLVYNGKVMAALIFHALLKEMKTTDFSAKFKKWLLMLKEFAFDFFKEAIKASDSEADSSSSSSSLSDIFD